MKFSILSPEIIKQRNKKTRKSTLTISIHHNILYPTHCKRANKAYKKRYKTLLKDNREDNKGNPKESPKNLIKTSCRTQEKCTKIIIVSSTSKQVKNKIKIFTILSKTIRHSGIS